MIAGTVSRPVLDGRRGTVEYEAGHGDRTPQPQRRPQADGRDPGVAVLYVADGPVLPNRGMAGQGLRPRGLPVR